METLLRYFYVDPLSEVDEMLSNQFRLDIDMRTRKA